MDEASIILFMKASFEWVIQMILTGSSIRQSIANEDIFFEPFDPQAINPNSINYRLGEYLYQVQADTDDTIEYTPVPREGDRFLLRKGTLYLGHTHEIIGSRKYVTSLIGRSSVGRLGLFVQVSANLGQMGAIHRWTLELFPTQDIYVYPGQTIGQVSFWTTEGQPMAYSGWFGRHNIPMLSKQHDPIFTTRGAVHGFNRT